MLRILRSVTVLEKIAFTVTLSRNYRIPVYMIVYNNTFENILCFCNLNLVSFFASIFAGC